MRTIKAKETGTEIIKVWYILCAVEALVKELQGGSEWL
jgi:hypothetical protein